MQTLSIAEFALRLGVGLGCGALIGIERQWQARRAGLRTNALVATGATLFVLYAVVTNDSSPTRVASYVVSGVGFLGGGVILREGFNVHGLNTAATLWCSAAVGVLAAGGHFLFAVDRHRRHPRNSPARATAGPSDRPRQRGGGGRGRSAVPSAGDLSAEVRKVRARTDCPAHAAGATSCCAASTPGARGRTVSL